MTALENFLDRLRTAPTTVNPPGWTVDWTDAPWPVVVREGGDRVPLDPRAPGTLGRLARLLLPTVVVSSVRALPPGAPGRPDGDPPPGAGVTMRRPVASGGSMYPTEVYVVIPGRRGAWAVDPYRHELVLVADGQAVDEVATLRGGCAAAVVLTSRFWKNSYKYGEFGYRLGAVDLGLVLGRLRRHADAVFGSATVVLDFDDDDLAARLSLALDEEAPYAVLRCGAARPGEPLLPFTRKVSRRSGRRVERSRSPQSMPLSRAALRRAVADTLPASPVRAAPPAAGIDLLSSRGRTRRSCAPQLRPQPMPQTLALQILQAAAVDVEALRARSTSELPPVRLLCCAARVDGLPAGWYRYESADRRLVVTGDGVDPAASRRLQFMLLSDTVNVERAALAVHVAAEARPWTRPGGARRHRAVQLVVGAAIDALTVAAAAVGLGSHPYLGFDAVGADARYRLAGSGLGVHAQVCLGPVRCDDLVEVEVRCR